MTPKLLVSNETREKLADKHDGVSVQDVCECFANRYGPYVEEKRPEHATDPPTYWFVAETDKGRRLKIVFVRYPENFALKSAYNPEDGSGEEYDRICALMVKNA